jgi:hypothetical protein
MKTGNKDSQPTAEARLAILELIAGYGILLDAGFGEYSDPDWTTKFRALWAREATFGTYPNLVVGQDMPIRGQSNIVSMFEEVIRSYPHPYFVRHLSTNTVFDAIDVQAGKARARSALIAAAVHDFSNVSLQRSGVYFDWFCVEDGHWCYERRDLIYDNENGPGAPPPEGWFRSR